MQRHARPSHLAAARELGSAAREYRHHRQHVSSQRLAELGEHDVRQRLRKPWARADTAGAILALRFREYTGSTLNGTVMSQITLTTSGSRYR
jgi:hypothetical protein